MAIWPNWRGRARERAARKAEERHRAEQDAARRHIADLAAAEALRQREQRDRRFPPEHRPDQVERRSDTFARNQPARWSSPAPSNPGHRHTYPATLPGRPVDRRYR